MGRRRKHVDLPDNLRGTLARNLGALMNSRIDLSTQPKVGARASIGSSSVGRALRAEAGTRLETVDAIAGAFGLKAWQLLYPGLEPEAPPQAEPVRLPLTPSETAALERARNAFAELNPRQRDMFVREGVVAELLQMPPALDERVEAALSTSRHGFPPGRREPLLKVREGGGKHTPSRAKKIVR